jgi:two-component system CheB/CheR fusion protein
MAGLDTLARLADSIVAQKDWIIARWLYAVQREPEIEAAAALTRQQLIDHLPGLCADLAERLRRTGMPQPQPEHAHAQSHGAHRWEQGYQIDEIIRESGLIRQVVAVECLDRFAQATPEFDGGTRRTAEAVIHRFFTDMLVESARQFAAEKDKAIRAVELNSAAILESSLDGIIVMDAAGHVREWNPAAVNLFGYTREEAIGAELASLIIPPQLRERHRVGLARYLRNGEGPLLGRRIEVPAVRADQSDILVELAITPYRVNDETLFTGSVRDITARRAAEEASQRLAAIVASTADAIISTDLDGTITSWNDGARQLLGYTAEEAIGQPIGMVIPPVSQREDDALMQRIGQGEKFSGFEAIRQRKDGSTVPVWVTLSPILDGSGRVIGASRITRDISERKQTEEELRRQKEAAEEANQAKDRFLAALSHELRTPLNPVLMWACATIENEKLDPEVRDGLRMICRNVEMEARLIDDLLDLTRVARGKLKLELQPCAADALLQHAMEIVRSQFRAKNLRIRTELAASNHRILADPTRIEQVFWNLLNNAQKFTPAGGEIAVRSYDAAPGVVAFEVSDTGRGIDPRVLPKLFQPFEQGSSAGQGLGLGLAICHAIVDLHGGTIRGENTTEAGGAMFTVQFNTIRAFAADDAPSTAQQAPGSRALRILIVEDHEHTATVMERLLAHEGHEVYVAATVREALDKLRSTPIDLLVSDLGLPDGNGFQVMRELTKISDAKGIAVSGYGMEEDLERSSRAGFSAHLTKPVNILKLKETIKQVVAS